MKKIGKTEKKLAILVKIQEKVALDLMMSQEMNWTPPVSWYFSRVLWSKLAEQLPKHPENIDEALAWIKETLLHETQVCSKRYLIRWEEVLRNGLSATVEVLVSASDNEPQVLRSCAPPPLIAGLMTEQERLTIYNEVANVVKSLKRKSTG